MSASVREALLLHALYLVIAAPLLLLGSGERLGLSLLWLTIAYNLLVPAWALLRGHSEWLWLWLFLVPLSAAQVLPDWTLVEIAGTLHFPDHGLYRIGGAVPVCFLGMWTAALFPIVLFAQASRQPYFVAGALSLALFALWEWAAVPLNIWEPRSATTVNGVALYVLLPEVLLGMATLHAYRRLRNHSWPERLVGALGVPVLYTGALFLSLLLTERVLSPV